MENRQIIPNDNINRHELKCYKVLSIQSHVVSGYVGNKSATFPLQILGFEVDSINSVQLSNHTGYRYWKGQILDAEELGEIFEGLKLNHLHHYTHLLTGYVGSVSFLGKVLEVVKDLKEENPDLMYVCDPVMGDNGKMYVPEDLLPVYRDQLTPLADIVTPNQFEAELLTGIKINTRSDAVQAMEVLHMRGIPTVVISSTELGSDKVLIALGSSNKNGKKIQIQLEIPQLPAVFTGTGDLFTALLLAWMTRTQHDLKVACEKTVNSLQDVLKTTYAHAKVTGDMINKYPGKTDTPIAGHQIRALYHSCVSKTYVNNLLNISF
ncbi:pyridoxal kinase isoform X1 [Tachypleus tridentatus]|uniref:pyridoxal kinase isoform X1 n=1 Tax=Tachypleus tridentatus TaxID=6853 RepID=UPI003FD427BA